MMNIMLNEQDQPNQDESNQVIKETRDIRNTPSTITGGEIDQLRQMILDDPESQSYDPKDMEFVKTKDIFIQVFLDTNKNIEGARKACKKWLAWSKAYDSNGINYLTFCKEFHQVGGAYFIEADRNGIPALLIRLKGPSPPNVLCPWIVKFFAWQLRKLFHQVMATGRRPGFILDFDSAPINLGLTKDILTIMVLTYPPCAQYVTFCNLNWSSNALYTVIKNFLPAFMRDRLATGNMDYLQNLTQTEDQLPHYLGGKLFSVSHEEWLECPSLTEWADSIGMPERDQEVLQKHLKKIVPILGNGWMSAN